MIINQVDQPDGGCRGKCSRVAMAGTTKPGGHHDDYHDMIVMMIIMVIMIMIILNMMIINIMMIMMSMI